MKRHFLLCLLMAMAWSCSPLALAQTFTYWTAFGEVKPLPQSDDGVLLIPGDALAVDLRGLSDINSTFTADASEANPNCLYYFNATDDVPQGLGSSANIIRNLETSFLLVDADHDYYCPLPFHAQAAMLDYPQRGSSATLVLPFDVQQAWYTNVNDAPGIDVDFNGSNMVIMRYVNFYSNLLHFMPVTEKLLHAYQPYLMDQLLLSPITFYAEEVDVPATRQAVSLRASYLFVGSTIAYTLPESSYRWDCVAKAFVKKKDADAGQPFTAYMDGSLAETLNESLSIDISSTPGEPGEGEGHPGSGSGITTTTQAADGKPTPVYTLSGQRVSQTSSGIYIIGGRKVVVR